MKHQKIKSSETNTDKIDFPFSELYVFGVAKISNILFVSREKKKNANEKMMNNR
jgi:hypothetical protein